MRRALTVAVVCLCGVLQCVSPAASQLKDGWYQLGDTFTASFYSTEHYPQAPPQAHRGRTGGRLDDGSIDESIFDPIFYLCVKDGKLRSRFPTFDYNQGRVELHGRGEVTNSYIRAVGSSYHKSNPGAPLLSVGSYQEVSIDLTTGKFTSYKITNTATRQGLSRHTVRLTGSIGKPVLLWTGDLEGCPAPKLVAINPYFSYPAGAPQVDLNRIARELNAPGTSPGFFPAGPAVARGIAADGAARVIVGFVTSDNTTPVTFDLPTSNRGGLGKLTKSVFSDPVGKAARVVIRPGEQSFVRIPGSGDKWAAAAVYSAPETPINFDGHDTITIRATQGRTVEVVRLSLEAPPLLLVHGLWGKPSAWETWAGLSEFPVVMAATYDGSMAFHLAKVQNRFRLELQNVINRARSKGLVTAQANVVAHSMGGLVTRAAWKSVDNRRLENFRAGDINRLITIDTPHLGSKLATTLWERRNVPVDFLIDRVGSLNAATAKLYFERMLGPWQPGQSPTLSQLMAAKPIDMPIGTAIMHLRPGSAGIGDLPSSSAFPYEAVSAWVSDSIVETALNLLLALTSDKGATVDSLLGSRNDAIVTLSSQKAGAARSREFAGLAHTDLRLSSTSEAVLDSAQVRSHVVCRLLNKTTCAGAAWAEQTAAASNDFSLAGYSRVPATELSLTGALPAKLSVNTEYQLNVSGTSRTIARQMFTVEQGGSLLFSDASTEGTIDFRPTTIAPLVLTVLAAFDDNTYAIRTREFGVNTRSQAVLIALEDDNLELRGIGATYQLRPIAYLAPPANGILDVTGLARYTITEPATSSIRVSSGGVITAVKGGLGRVSVAFGGTTTSLDVVVRR